MMRICSRSKKTAFSLKLAFLCFTLFILFGCGGGGSSGNGGGAANTPPTADAGNPQTVDEGAAVFLDGSLSTDSDGNIVSYDWVQVSGTQVTLNNANTANPSFIAPAVTGSENSVFRLTVTDDGGESDSDDVVVTVNVTSSITASQETAPASVNLTVEGSSDWAHWGRTAALQINRKGPAPPANLIGDYSEIGNASFIFQTGIDLDPGFSWSDGDPTLADNDVRRGVTFSYVGGPGTQIGNGYSLTLNADSTSQTLRLYLGAINATGKIVAELDDGSATSTDVFVINPTGDTWLNRVITITFRAAAPTTMTVSYTLDDDHGTDSALQLQAATLSGGTVSAPTLNPPEGEFTDQVQVEMSTTPSGSTIYYTLDGSDPNTSSNLYTSPVLVTADTTVKAKAFRAGYTESETTTGLFTVNAGAGGSLSAFVENAPFDVVNLTNEGGTDWAHWGRTDVNEINRKGPVAVDLIGDYSIVNGVNFIFQTGGATLPTFEWFDGDPTVTAFSTDQATNVRRGITFSFTGASGTQIGNGFSLTLDADATPRTLKLYLGAFDATGRITATLNDAGASAEDAEVLITNPTMTWLNKVVTIDFQAAAATTLTVSYTLDVDNGTDSALQLQAATLQ